MKKNILILCCLVFSLSVIGQEPKNPTLDSLKAANPQNIRSIIKTNPTAILIGTMPILTAEYRLLGEFATGTKQSTQIGFSYLGKSVFIKLLEVDTVKKSQQPKFEINGFRVQASYRFYMNDWMQALGFASEPVYAPRGFYISPHFSYTSVTITTNPWMYYHIYVMGIQYNANLLAGFQYILFDKFSVDNFIGLGYKQNLWFIHGKNGVVQQVPNTDLKNIPGYTSDLKITIGINFGYCF